MASKPPVVSNGASVEEIADAIAPEVHDTLDDLAVVDRPGLAGRVVEQMAAEITPDHPETQSSDLSRLFAEKINAVRREFGMGVLDVGALEGEILARGGAMGPAPGDPMTPIELTPDEVRERTRKARLFAAEVMAQPSAKKRRTLDAIAASPAMGFFNPEAAVYRVNGVEIHVPEGEIQSRDLPGGDVCGCTFVARLVYDSGAARKWEAMQQRVLKETIIYGDEDQRPDYLSTAPQRGMIR